MSAAASARKKAAVVARRPATAPLRAPQKAPAGPASAEDTASPLKPGDNAPSFELLDQQGAPVSSASLAGQPYVLYFYPKDDTPGCTTQACGFRDAFPDFESAGIRVLGVSPDSVASHQKFVGKYGLPFTLLSDGSRELASAYGVWALKKNYGREFMGIVRSTFLVDGEGIVRKAWRSVRVNGHVPAVQAAAAELG
jgi:thioredoxin-dependent peroxiredoxin